MKFFGRTLHLSTWSLNQESTTLKSEKTLSDCYETLTFHIFFLQVFCAAQVGENRDKHTSDFCRKGILHERMERRCLRRYSVLFTCLFIAFLLTFKKALRDSKTHDTIGSSLLMRNIKNLESNLEERNGLFRACRKVFSLLRKNILTVNDICEFSRDLGLSYFFARM